MIAQPSHDITRVTLDDAVVLSNFKKSGSVTIVLKQYSGPSYTMPDCFSYRIASIQSDTKILAVTLLRSAYSYARYQEYTIFCNLLFAK